jgi:hypothetical protein
MSPLHGERRDRPTYSLRERLGDGRGDIVVLAYHHIFGGTCVQKTVRMHGLEDALASSEPAFMDRLDHPWIVPVREAQWDPEGEQAITFVMPLMEGGSVHEALKEAEGGLPFLDRQARSPRTLWMLSDISIVSSARFTATPSPGTSCSMRSAPTAI